MALRMCFTCLRPRLGVSLSPISIRGVSRRARVGSRVQEGRSWRVALKEAAFSPSRNATEKAFAVGQLAVGGGAVVGVGALCYYGLGMSARPGTLEMASFWPGYVKERVRSTYAHLLSSLAITAGSAIALSRSPALLRTVTPRSPLGAIALVVSVMGSSFLVMSLPYEGGASLKHLAWAGHSCLLGVVLCPLAGLGGTVLIRAAWTAAGITMATSLIAACAPSDAYMSMAAPLGAGLGLVAAASLGSLFLPVGSALGSAVHVVSLYGGLLVFSWLLVSDTQRAVRQAETLARHDPINSSMAIYMDVVNIFIRLAIIMGGGGGKRK
uniref:Growth hormone inducible transmembrane protein n=1 Tax=Eptatretus burgeri TaxID=7764 RepID=A0A8C4R432_EPTBU